MKTRTLVALLALAASGHAQSNFIQIISDPIIGDPGLHSRGAWGDFNNDGFLDVFIATYDGYSFFHTNNGNGTFTLLAEALPAQDLNSHTGAAAADYDNDGWLDLVSLSGAFASSAEPLFLYHNSRDGTFSRASGGGMTNRLGFYNACAWADYDNDGFVDLLVTDNGDSNAGGGSNYLFHNNRNGTFSKVTTGAIASDVGVGWGIAWGDYDNDGFMDLLVLNYSSSYPRNFLYHNDRDGTFTRVTNNLIATDLWPNGCQCGVWADYDNDGLLDLYITDNGGHASRLYHNNGKGSFSSVASAPGLPVGLSYGAVWGDYDNDGYLDLFVSGVGTNGLFHNNQNGTFTQILTGPIASSGLPGITQDGCSWVDYDNDGFLDLFIENYNNGNLLFHNTGNGSGWLEVKLVGTVGNRSAIGAKVSVYTTIGGKTFWQLRQLNNGGGWNLQPLVAHFGLGDATNVATVRIEWPSGTVQEFQNIAPKQVLTITEPAALIPTDTKGAPQFSLKAWPGMQFDIQASTNLSQWLSIGTVTVTNPAGLTPIVDTNASGAAARFYRAVSRGIER